MRLDNPDSVFDVAVHDIWENIYRVAFFGKLSDDWLREWETYFYEMDGLAGHAAHIAQALHKTNGLSFLDGYGPISWMQHSWRVVKIVDKKGKTVAYATVKLLNARNPTKKYDYITTEEVEWEGFDVVIDKQRLVRKSS